MKLTTNKSDIFLKILESGIQKEAEKIFEDYKKQAIKEFDEAKDKNFNYMTFDMAQTNLLNKYLREDYGE